MKTVSAEMEKEFLEWGFGQDVFNYRNLTAKRLIEERKERPSNISYQRFWSGLDQAGRDYIEKIELEFIAIYGPEAI